MLDRLTCAASCERLQKLGFIDGSELPMPSRMPRHDDLEPLGVSFFKSSLNDELDMSNLTLPRTFFGRSDLSKVSIKNTNSSESNLCWNEFVAIDFGLSDLSLCDGRSSNFYTVTFSNSDLTRTDLRHSRFKHCVFYGAIMDGTILTRTQAVRLSLSNEQRSTIDWRWFSDPVPDGG